MSDDLNINHADREPQPVPHTGGNGSKPPGGNVTSLAADEPAPHEEDPDDECGGVEEAEPERPSVLDDAEDFRLDPNEEVQESVKVLGPVPVRKMPGKQVFFRVKPDTGWRLATVVHEDDEQGTFIVVKKMRPYVEETRPVVILTCITSTGVEFFWPVPLPQDGQNSLSLTWSKSKRRAAALAETKWIKVKSNKAGGTWDTFVAKGKLEEPRWSARTFKEMFDSAFADKIVRDMSHPVIKGQQGLA